MSDSRTLLAYVVTEESVYTHRVAVAPPDIDQAIALAVQQAQTEHGCWDDIPDAHHRYVVTAHYSDRAIEQVGTVSGFPTRRPIGDRVSDDIGWWPKGSDMSDGRDAPGFRIVGSYAE